MKRSFVPFVCMLALSLPSLPAEKPDAKSGSSVPAIPTTKAQIRTLPNGLTVIVEEDRSAPVASVQAWCGTGSIDEGKHLGAGLSHILEHMLFKGTEKRKAGQIANQIQDQGGYINAYTTYDRTVYWIDVPKTGVSEAIAILSDAMMNSTLPEEEYAKEQEVIRREFAMGFDDPNRMSSQLMFRTVFQQSPYRHPVIGHLDVYNKLSREDVLEYYKSRYVPNNLALVIVGDVNAAEVFAQVEKEFASVPRRSLEPVYIPEEPKQLGRRTAHEEFPTELTRLSLSWQIPGLSDADTPALDVLSTVLGGGRSTPLYRELREKQGIVHTISAGTYSPAKAGIFVIQAVCDPDNRTAAETEALKVVATVQKNGVSREELEKAKKGMISSQLGQWTTMRGKASDLGSNWSLTRNLDFSRDYLEEVAKLTPEDIQRVARKYLTAEALCVTSLNPVGSLAKGDTQPVVASESSVQKFELANGLRLLVREDPRLPLVSIVAAFRGGLLAEQTSNNGITSLLARSMIKGTKNRTAAQIAEEIEAVGGAIGADSGNNSFTAEVSVLKPDLKLGMNLLADVLLHPTFPEAEVGREKAVQIAGIKAEQDQITTVARNTLREHLFGSHPYALRSSGTQESVASLTPAALKTFHNQLGTARNGVIAVFGDVKASEVKALAEKEFGSMPSGSLAMADPAQPAPLTSRVTVEENRNKQQAVVMIGYPGLTASDPDAPVLELIESASSDLGSRFFDRIREKNALAYFVGAFQFAGLAPGVFGFYLGTDPLKVDKAREEFQDEISKLAAEGLTDEELVRAKKKTLGEDAIQRQGNSAFARAVAIDELVGLGYDNYLKRESEIGSVTLDDTKRVAKRILQNPGSVEAIVKPAATAQTPASPQTP